ncbi:MAG: transporter [Symploca sp. SIO1B1]|nr:transporter [Symploca sp. SIO1B1]
MFLSCSATTKAEVVEYAVTPKKSVPLQDLSVITTTGFSAEVLEPINAIAIDQTPVPELNNPELVAQPSQATSNVDTNTEELDWHPASSTTLPIQQDELDRQDASATGVFFLSDSDDGSLSSNGELQWTSARPDGHAPISVMGEHTHQAGEFMFSYRYMFMRMDGNRDGTDDLSDQEVLQQFPVTPTNMDMEMHMFGGMYAPTDDLTLMVMIPYVLKEMDHVTRTGVNFTTNSEGFGDLQLTGLYNVLRQNRQRVHFNLGFSFPTGSIDERDDTPAGNNLRLPYPMQIGSGTFDLKPGVTYLGQADKFSWGAQANTVLRLGENSNDYRLGNQFNLTGWVASKWVDWLSTSLRLDFKTLGNISGADPLLNPMMIPTADPDRRGGERLDLGLGLNLYAPSGALKGTRLGVEFVLPMVQSLDGPQLETDWQLTIGVQASF